MTYAYGRDPIRPGNCLWQPWRRVVARIIDGGPAARFALAGFLRQVRRTDAELARACLSYAVWVGYPSERAR